MSRDPGQIPELVRELTEAWIDERFEVLVELHEPDVVLRVEGEAEPLVGPEPIVASYRRFLAEVELDGFEVLAASVDALDDETAAVRLDYAIRYEVSGQLLEERGVDVMVWRRHPGGWRIAWRTQVATGDPDEVDDDEPRIEDGADDPTEDDR